MELLKSQDRDWSIPDWTREQPSRYWDPPRKLLASIRSYQRFSGSSIFSQVVRKLCVLRWRFWSVVTGADIPLNTRIDGGLLMPHPNGIVMHPDCEIGANCLIFQQVTLAGKVVLGNHVDIGAGAKIIDPVSVGDNVKIGANTVVLCDILSDSIVVGVPCRYV